MRRIVFWLAITTILPLAWRLSGSDGRRLFAAVNFKAMAAEAREVMKTVELASPNAPPAPPAASPGAAVTTVSPRMVEDWLRQAPASKTPPTGLRCVDGATGWNFVCAYGLDPAQPWLRVKIGVRVSPDGIEQATPAAFLWAALPHP
jgi:hypothetical protein